MTIQDVIRWIQEDPEAKEELRRTLLTEELLNLPQRFARLVELSEQNARDIAQNTRDIARLIEITEQHGRDIARLIEITEQHGRDIARLIEITEQHGRDIARLIQDFARLVEDFRSLVKIVEQQGQDIGMLKGLALESALQGRAISLLSGRFKLRRGRVMRGPVMIEMNHEFEDAVDAATDAGVITEDQNRRIFNTDLVARARDSATGDVVYVAAEASFTIEPKDVRRAHESARALRLVFPSNDVKTAVFGAAISIQDSDWAKQEGVEVFTLELPR